MRSALYTGTLMHSRRTPRRNVFRYPISYWLVDLDELPELERLLWAVRVNRRGLVTFRDGDHFDGSEVKAAAIAFTGDPTVTRVLMLTQLRVLGYVFNPVSFYWCYRADGELACMISEVGNTFGERMPELLHGPGLHYAHDKHLHVSPFFGLDQRYEYAFSEPGDEVWARIHVHDAGEDADDGRPPRPPPRADQREPREDARAVSAAAAPGHGADPLAGRPPLAERVPFHHKPPFIPGEGRGAHVTAPTLTGSSTSLEPGTGHVPSVPGGLRGFSRLRTRAPPLGCDTFVSITWHRTRPGGTRRSGK